MVVTILPCTGAGTGTSSMPAMAYISGSSSKTMYDGFLSSGAVLKVDLRIYLLKLLPTFLIGLPACRR
jgi:hypothetical protein